MGRVRLGRVVLWAGMVELIGYVATVAFTVTAKQVLAFPAWLLAPALAVFAGIVKALAEALAHPEPTHPEPVPVPGTWDWPQPAPGSARHGHATARHGTSLVAAVMTVLLVFGIGGYALSYEIHYVTGWVSGTENGVSRLVASRSASSGAVTLTVTEVTSTDHFTRVRASVLNGEHQPASLPLFHNVVLTAGDTTLQADPFRSQWSEEVPPGSRQTGWITFPGHLSPDAVTAQFSVLMVLVDRPANNDSIVVKDLRLTALQP